MTANEDYSTWTVFALENRFHNLKAIINNKAALRVTVSYPAYPYTKGTDNQRVILPMNERLLKKTAVEELKKNLAEIEKYWKVKFKEEQQKFLEEL